MTMEWRDGDTDDETGWFWIKKGKVFAGPFDTDDDAREWLTKLK